MDSDNEELHRRAGRNARVAKAIAVGVVVAVVLWAAASLAYLVLLAHRLEVLNTRQDEQNRWIQHQNDVICRAFGVTCPAQPSDPEPSPIFQPLEASWPGV